MRYIKLFEDQNMKEPEVGDWVLMTHWWAGKHLHDNIDNTPGQIIFKNKVSGKNGDTLVRYIARFVGNQWIIDNFDEEVWDKEFSTISGFQEIEHWIKYVFKNTEDLEVFLDAKKYNL